MQLYTRPANTFVARFTGMPPMNLVAAPLPGVNAPAGTTVGIRPHDVRITAPGEAPVTATVDVVEPRGPDSLVHLTIHLPGAAVSVVAVVAGTVPPAGTMIGVHLPQDRLHFFDSDGRRVEP
jgi:ABC-type sugar transport system ATPase subunit